MGGAAVRNGTVIRHPANQLDVLNVFMILNATACGSSLIGGSHLVAYSPATISASNADAPLPGPAGGVISQDGRTAYAQIRTPGGTPELVAISAATGRVTRVLLSGSQVVEPSPMSIDGTSLLFPLNLRHLRLRQTGQPYVSGHLAMIDVATGHIRPLPIRLYYGTGVPAPPVGAAW